jgi:hypothetical protein
MQEYSSSDDLPPQPFSFQLSHVLSALSDGSYLSRNPIQRRIKQVRQKGKKPDKGIE